MLKDNLTIALFGITLMILLLVMGMVLVIVQARKQRLQQQLNEAVYKSKLNSTTLAALRAQMNPHFIFNCLNSIKLYTEQNNAAAASDYLDTFSKLIRNMLDSSRTEIALLSNELETLQLYLEMETLRFKNKLQYSITVDDAVEADFIEIPPLLIQPYVENAIWHGLMQRPDGGHVTIHIAQQQDALYITVKDDGIGRAASAALKQQTSFNHRSHGTTINADRIALLNENSVAAATISTADITDGYGKPAGTLVTIQLPIK